MIRWQPVDESIARIAGELGRRYRSSHSLGVADLVVAATSKHLELPLATADAEHFPMFHRLERPY